MPEPFALSTADPLFSPEKPVRVNDHDFAPVRAAADREGLADFISEAISDSLDIDWEPSDGARAVVDALEEDGLIVVPKSVIEEASKIIGQIESDFRHPPACSSQERRIERARKWLAENGGLGG